MPIEVLYFSTPCITSTTPELDWYCVVNLVIEVGQLNIVWWMCENNKYVYEKWKILLLIIYIRDIIKFVAVPESGNFLIFCKFLVVMTYIYS